METINDTPTAGAFVSLSTHQSQTPESFFNGPPVLYHHSPSAKLSIQSAELAFAPALAKLFEGLSASQNGSAPVVNGDTPPAADLELSVEAIDVWVTSERFILFSTQKSTGVSIPYPSISLHAIERSSGTSPAKLFLQILTQSPTFDDYDPDSTICLFLTPTAGVEPSVPQPPAAETPIPATPTETPTTEPIQELYTALSACADLHPDPGTPGSDDEGANIIFEGDTGENYTTLSNGQQTALPPPMPGSGGWITAENVGDFFDEEGNWRGQNQSLGEGAGSVRRREDDDDADEEGVGVDGNGIADGEETKWRRTG